MTLSDALRILLELWQHLVVKEGYADELHYCIPNLTLPNQCFPMELFSLSPHKGTLPSATLSPAGESLILSHFKVNF